MSNRPPFFNFFTADQLFTVSTFTSNNGRQATIHYAATQRQVQHKHRVLKHALLCTSPPYYPSIVDSRLYSQADPQCSLSEEEFLNDPAVQTMNFDLGYGP